MPMRDASLKQRIPCIICISIFRAFSVEKSVRYGNSNGNVFTYCTYPNMVHGG